MKLLRTALLSLSLLPVQAQATGNTPFTSPSKLSDNQKLCEGKNTTAKNQVPHFSKMLKKVAWYQDRDNSMEGVDINEDSADGKVGRAMATVFGNGPTQGIQVCSGVYLATAHGILHNPTWADCTHIRAKKDKCKKQKLRSASENFHGGSHYPLSEKTVFRASSDQQYVSPILNNIKSWDDKSTDYVFIKVDKVIKPNDYIVPLNASSHEIISAAEKGNEIHLFRGKTRFKKDINNIPDFNYNTLIRGLQGFKKLYKTPQKVTKRCSLVKRREIDLGIIDDTLTVHDCPTESNVSGSPLIMQIKNKPYLVGMHVLGRDAKLKNLGNGFFHGGTFLNSTAFCQDYKKVCGRPCVTLEEALKKE